MFRSHFTILFLCLTLSVQAGHFTLDSAVQHALSHNPELAAARFSIVEAQGRLLQSGRRTNPELESEIRPNVRGREISYGVGFMQKFPLTNRLRLEKAVSEAGVILAEAEVRAAELKLATAVRMVGVKLLSLDGSKALKEKMITNSRELAAAAAKIAAQAEGSALEATQFELEVQQLSLDLLQLDATSAALQGEARPLLGVPVTESVEFTGSLPEPALPGNTLANIFNRGDYQAALARLEAARQNVALTKANKWEDAGIGLSASVDRTEDAPDGLQTDGFIGIKFSLPLPFWNKNEGKIKEAEATVSRTEMEAEAVAAQARAEGAAALGEMKAALRIVQETNGKLLPKAREIEEKIAAFYKQAQPGTQLSDLLRSREKRLTIEQASLDALRAYHLARVRFNAALGH